MVEKMPMSDSSGKTDSPGRLPLPDMTARQIAETEIDSARPLIITDADEVILQFVRPLEDFLDARGLYLDISSFRLSGNVKRRNDDVALPHEEVMALIGEFFATGVETCLPVEGAVGALSSLSEVADVLVLSNLPLSAKAGRQRNLAAHGMDYPLIVNEGPKGPAIRALIEGHAAPAVFLDDIPYHHDSAAAEAQSVHRIHFVADPRLAPLLKPAPSAHARIDCWAEAERHLRSLFADAGF